MFLDSWNPPCRTCRRRQVPRCGARNAGETQSSSCFSWSCNKTGTQTVKRSKTMFIPTVTHVPYICRFLQFLTCSPYVDWALKSERPQCGHCTGSPTWWTLRRWNTKCCLALMTLQQYWHTNCKTQTARDALVLRRFQTAFFKLRQAQS